MFNENDNNIYYATQHVDPEICKKMGILSWVSIITHPSQKEHLRGIYGGTEIGIIFPSGFERGVRGEPEAHITLDVCAGGCSEPETEDIVFVCS